MINAKKSPKPRDLNRTNDLMKEVLGGEATSGADPRVFHFTGKSNFYSIRSL